MLVLAHESDLYYSMPMTTGELLLKRRGSGQLAPFPDRVRQSGGPLGEVRALADSGRLSPA